MTKHRAVACDIPPIRRWSGIKLAGAVLAIACFESACAGRAERHCSGGESRWQSDTLYFGATRANGDISAEDWKWFLDTEITPRFPAGLSWWQASGQWRDKAGVIGREPSYILQLLHAPGAQADRSLSDIVHLYETDFGQESVLRVRETACVAF